MLGFDYYRLKYDYLCGEVVQADGLMLRSTAAELPDQKHLQYTAIFIDVRYRTPFLFLYEFSEFLVKIDGQDPSITELSMLVKL